MRDITAQKVVEETVKKCFRDFDFKMDPDLRSAKYIYRQTIHSDWIRVQLLQVKDNN